MLDKVFVPGMKKRWWMFRVIDAVLWFVPHSRTYTGLLIVRADGMGDLAIFLRDARYYAQAFGVSEKDVHIIGGQGWGGVANHLLGEMNVEIIDEQAFQKNLFYRLKYALRLARQSYHTVVCDRFFRRTLIHDSLVAIARARRKVVAKPYTSEKTEKQFAYYLQHVDEVVDTGPHPTHELERQRRFLAHFGVASTDHEVDLRLPAEPRYTVPDGPYAVLNFGSSEVGRNWPFGNYLELARRFVDEGVTTVFVGASNELPRSAELEKALPSDRIVNLIGQTCVTELLHLLRSATLVVTNETGPGHFAIMLGAPTIMIYGGGHAGSFMPYPEHRRPANAHFINEDMPCYHCLWRCPYRPDKNSTYPCISAISIDTVWSAVSSILETSDNQFKSPSRG